MSSIARRPKAQDVFNEANFVMGTKTTFENAFPEIEQCTVEVKEQGHNVPEWDKVRTVRNPGQYINCHNKLCYGGGFDVGWTIHEMVGKRETERSGSTLCQGNEASAKGRRIYKKCMTFFEYKISIKYKVQEVKAV
ncbi:MAG: hypothetical protein ACLQAH_01245 [Limisphaerales bacterium]